MRRRRIVFTKPWRGRSIDGLALTTADLGFDGVELPVRPGYQIEPQNAERDLPAATETFRSRGVDVVSIAAEPDEAVVRACEAAGVGMIRTMVPIDMRDGYRTGVERARDRLARLTPILKNSGVRVGIQNHCDYFVGSAVGLVDLVAPLDAEAVCVVLDFAHCSLDGEPVDMAIDIAGDRIGLVNFKSAYRRRVTGVNTTEATWRIDWTTARDSLYSWRFAVAKLGEYGYRDAVCLPAEYSTGDGEGFLEGDAVLPYLSYDLAYLDSLRS